jgi:hypothetical protein
MDVIKQLPVAELEQTMSTFVQPVLDQLPEKRLKAVVMLILQGLLAGQSPLITQIARGVDRTAQSTWSTAKRIYRFMWNPRFSHRELLKGLYGVGQQRVAAYQPEALIVAIDPVNFEKPYTKKLAGVSTVMKSTPPSLNGQKRLTRGYPAITATMVNLPEPVITYANWFSYTLDFRSENWEIYRAIRTTCALFPDQALCFVADSGFDDQKIFHQMDRVQAAFVIRVQHENRWVEVYNDRLDRWEAEHLNDLIATVPFVCELNTQFHHARQVRTVAVRLGWFKIRIATTFSVLWVLVIHDPQHEKDIALITNRPLDTARDAQIAFITWRHRPFIEHTYRLDQEAGLDVEDMRVQTLERMRRLFVLVLLAALFVYFIDQTWPEPAVTWLRHLGGKLDLVSDLDGPYILLAGIGAVYACVATLTFVLLHPFPRLQDTYG